MIIYIGPNIRGVVNRNQIFNYNPEEIIKKALSREPLAGYLFVDTKDIVAKKEEMERKGSVLNIAYQRVAKKEAINGTV